MFHRNTVWLKCIAVSKRNPTIEKLYRDVCEFLETNTCSISLGTPEIPIITPTGHIFDYETLQKWIEELNGREFECPVTRNNWKEDDFCINQPFLALIKESKKDMTEERIMYMHQLKQKAEKIIQLWRGIYAKNNVVPREKYSEIYNQNNSKIMALTTLKIVLINSLLVAQPQMYHCVSRERGVQSISPAKQTSPLIIPLMIGILSLMLYTGVIMRYNMHPNSTTLKENHKKNVEAFNRYNTQEVTHDVPKRLKGFEHESLRKKELFGKQDLRCVALASILAFLGTSDAYYNAEAIFNKAIQDCKETVFSNSLQSLWECPVEDRGLFIDSGFGKGRIFTEALPKISMLFIGMHLALIACEYQFFSRLQKIKL